MIHNISIATDDGIIHIGDGVNIYHVYLSRAIIIWGNCLYRLEQTIVSDHIFCQFLQFLTKYNSNPFKIPSYNETLSYKLP